MRRTIITALAVLFLSLGLCVAGTGAVNRAVDEIQALRQAAERDARLGNVDAARADMAALGKKWKSRERVLELVVSHDDLSEVWSNLENARLCLEQGARGEFYRASAAAGIGLDRIRAAEALRWENLY